MGGSAGFTSVDRMGATRRGAQSRRKAAYRVTRALAMGARGAALVRKPACAVLVTGLLHLLCTFYMLPQGRYVGRVVPSAVR